jgi:quinol monooxygenase YgiN
MITYAGCLWVDPERRDEFVGLRERQVLAGRAEPGCLAYAITADSTEPGLVQVFEVYADEEALAAHVAVHDRNHDIPVLRMEIYRYDSDGRSSLAIPRPPET